MNLLSYDVIIEYNTGSSTTLSQQGKLGAAIRAPGMVSCTPCKVQCLTLALLTLRDVIYDVTKAM